jgi:hypothetical protein
MRMRRHFLREEERRCPTCALPLCHPEQDGLLRSAAASVRRVFLRARGGFLFALLALLAFTLPALAEPRLTATLDRDTITQGESATLSLAFEEVSPTSTPQLPELPNLTAQFIGQSSQFQFVNGQTSRKLVFSYAITATQPGDYRIPGFSMELNGQKLTTSPLTLKVVKAGDSVAGGDANAPKAAFVRLIAPTNDVYVGELFPVELQLFYQEADDIQMPEFKTDGFVIGRQAGHTRARAQANGLIYNVVSFKMSLSAARAGKLPLGPAQCRLSLRVPRAGAQRNRIGFFDFPGFNVDLKPVTLAADPLTINVLPLPTDNVPPGFTGSIGSFALELHASPTNVTVGDPITLRVRIAGRGTLDSIALPSFDTWREFKSYPPNSKVESEDPLGIEGAKSFEVVVSPQNAEVKSLPPLKFSFFDPAQRAYRTLTQPGVPLLVRATGAARQQPTVLAGVAEETAAPATRDIVHIKPRAGELLAITPPLLARPWFLALQAVPLLAFCAAFMWRRRQEQLANNPRLRRQLAVRDTVRRGLEEMRAHAAAGRASEFHSALFRLLQEQLGERLDQPASGITEEAVESLRALGADDATAAALHDLFRRCNEARYAPHTTSEELASVATAAEQVLGVVAQLRAGGQP